MFEEIWEKYDNNLKRFINSKVKDNEVTKDLLQDVAIKAMANIDSVKDTAKYKSWLFSIANNVIMDYFRKSNKEIIENDEHIEYYTPKEDSEILNCITNIVEHLPAKYSQAIKDVEYDELSQKEFADKNNLTYTNAKARVQRARKQLGELISSCCEIETNDRGEVLDFKHTKNSCKYKCCK